MSFVLSYLVLVLTASACVWAEDDNAKQKAHTLAITKANDAYDYLLQNKVKVGKPELDNSILCVNKLKESLEKLVEAKDFNAAIKVQQDCANAIKTTSGVMSDVKAKVEAAVKAIQAANAPSNAPSSEGANTVTKAQNHAAVKAAEAYLWLAGQKDNIVESEQGLADKCAENIAAGIKGINEGDYKSAISNLSACANSLQGDRLPELKEKTMEALSACKATEASMVALPPQQSTGGAIVQKDPEMVANEAYTWLRNPDNTDKLGKPEKEAVEKCTNYIASSINEIGTKDYKKAIDSLLNCANSTLKGQLLPEVYKKSMEVANLCQTLKRINNKAATAPSSDTATAPALSSDGSDDSGAPAPSSEESDDSSAPAPSDGSEEGADAPAPSNGDDSAAPAPSSEESDDSATQLALSSDDSSAPAPSDGSEEGADSPAPSNGNDSAAPAPSSEESDDSATQAPSSDDSSASAPSDGSEEDADAPAPSNGDDSATPAPSSDESDDSGAPAPSSDETDDYYYGVPAPSSDKTDDSGAPSPSSDGSDSAARDTEAQKKATNEADEAYLLINDNRTELDKLDPDGTDACFKSLAAAMTNIAEDVYHKAQLELQDCVNALPSPKGQLVDVKAKAQKAIEHLKAQ